MTASDDGWNFLKYLISIGDRSIMMKILEDVTRIWCQTKMECLPFSISRDREENEFGIYMKNGLTMLFILQVFLSFFEVQFEMHNRNACSICNFTNQQIQIYFLLSIDRYYNIHYMLYVTQDFILKIVIIKL